MRKKRTRQKQIELIMDSHNIAILPQYLFSCECGHYFVGTEKKRRCSKCYAANQGVKLGN